MNMISLVGEQPLPVLLPSLHLNPGNHLLVHTERTRVVAKRLSQFIPACSLKSVPAYGFDDVRRAVQEGVDPDQGWVLNLTGGTKMMALAAFSLAVDHSLQFVYLKSENQQNVLMSYSFQDGEHRKDHAYQLPELIDLDQYLRVHLPGFTREGPNKNQDGTLSEGGKFERALAEALEDEFDEVMVGVRPEGVADQIEIDLLIRKGNEVGIIEAKTSGRHQPKRGIDQLTTAGSRKYLGTYTHRFFIVGSMPEDQRVKVLAAENNIHIIPMVGYSRGKLSSNDRRRLLARLLEKMEPA